VRVRVSPSAPNWRLILPLTERMTLTRCITLTAATLLAGCALSEEQAGRILVSPNKYEFYQCDDIDRALADREKRREELEALMVKAGPGTGAFVSDIAYKPEYLQVRGQIDQLRRTAADKHCDTAPRRR